MGEPKLDLSAIITELRGRKTEPRVFALMAIGLVGQPEHAREVIDLLASPDETVLMAAIDCLGRLRAPGALKHLVDFIDHDNPRVVDKALAVLPAFDVRPAITRLLAAAGMASRPEPVRRRLLGLLVGLDDARVQTFMGELLFSSVPPSLLALAAHYFARHPAAIRAERLEELSEHSNWEVALQATLARSRLGDVAAVGMLEKMARAPALPLRQALCAALAELPLRAADRPVFERLLADPNGAVRLRAMAGLRLWSDSERRQWLRQQLRDEREESGRLSLLAAIEAERDPASIPAVLPRLADASEPVKCAARQAITVMGPAAVGTVLEQFDRQPLVVREQLAIVLGECGDPRALPRLWQCIGGSERWLRLHAIQAVAALGDRTAVPRLQQLLTSENDVWIRATLLSALAMLGGPELEPVFAAHLQHPDIRVRANAVEALGRLNTPTARDLVLPAFDDANDRVRVNAAIARWRLGDPDVLPALRALCSDKNKWVRSSSAFALGEIGDPAAVPELLGLLRDRDEVVYRNSFEALAKIAEISTLIPLLQERERGRLSEAVIDRWLRDFVHRLLVRAGRS